MIKPVPYHFELPGIPVNSLPTHPPVHDSAVEIVKLFSDNKVATFSAKEFKSLSDIDINKL